MNIFTNLEELCRTLSFSNVFGRGFAQSPCLHSDPQSLALLPISEPWPPSLCQLAHDASAADMWLQNVPGPSSKFVLIARRRVMM